MERGQLYLKKKLWERERGKPRAAALRYDPDQDGAPRLVASGQGALAERILEVARQSQVPVVEDTLLTEALMCMDLEQEIPPELYLVVAEVLAYIYRVYKQQ